jgi:acyl-CoA reductase-like NAD-dependent aldehyde dehydrogenase
VARTEQADLDRALAAAGHGFKAWRKVSAYDRGKILRKAGDLLRARAEAIAPVMTREHGKPRVEAQGEVASGADILDWFAEGARRTAQSESKAALHSEESHHPAHDLQPDYGSDRPHAPQLEHEQRVFR